MYSSRLQFITEKSRKNLSGKTCCCDWKIKFKWKTNDSVTLKENCTVTITHSKTKDLKAECNRADIIIAAVGIPKLVKGDWVKKVLLLLMLVLIKRLRHSR